jgi:6-phosphofructokinase
MGAAAVEALRRGECDSMIATKGSEIITVPFATFLGQKKKASQNLLTLCRILSS